MVQHDNKPRRFAAYICMALSIAAALLSAVLCARLPFTAPADAEEVSVSPAAEPELPPLPAPEEIPAPAPESAGPADGGRDSAAPEAGGEAAGIRPGDLMAGYIDGLIFIKPTYRLPDDTVLPYSLPSNLKLRFNQADDLPRFCQKTQDRRDNEPERNE